MKLRNKIYPNMHKPKSVLKAYRNSVALSFAIANFISFSRHRKCMISHKRQSSSQFYIDDQTFCSIFDFLFRSISFTFFRIEVFFNLIHPFFLTWIAFVQTQERRIYIQEKILFDLVLLRYIFLGSYTMIECYHVNPYSYLKRGWQDFTSIYFISSRFFWNKNAMHVSLKRVAFKQFYLHHLIA